MALLTMWISGEVRPPEAVYRAGNDLTKALLRRRHLRSKVNQHAWRSWRPAANGFLSQDLRGSVGQACRERSRSPQTGPSPSTRAGRVRSLAEGKDCHTPQIRPKQVVEVVKDDFHRFRVKSSHFTENRIITFSTRKPANEAKDCCYC